VRCIMLNLLLHAGVTGHIHGYELIGIVALAVVGVVSILTQRE